MSVTPGLGSFNKDKVANKFGIQLKKKDTNKQSQQPLNPSTEKININTDTSAVTENKTVSDSCLQNQSNGLKSKTPEPLRKTLENSSKSKSSVGLVSTLTYNERRDSFNSNVNHSTSLNPVKSNSQSSLTTLSSSQSPDTIKQSSLISKNRSKSPSPSLSKRTSIIKTTTEQPMSQTLSSKQTNIPTSTTKTVAEIEHQKDQPLYKRQLSKTLDNVANKNKYQQQELTTR
jgi:hypothetical protein